MSTTIYLVRHAIAPDAAAGEPDEERPLTPEGARKMARVALGLKQQDIAVDVLLCSPLRRARETAEILAEVFGGDLQVQVCDALSPGRSAATAARAIARHRSAAGVFAVGHQPGIAQLASHLLTGSADALWLPFKKGGVAAIQLAEPGETASLLWFSTPAQLRAIAD